MFMAKYMDLGHRYRVGIEGLDKIQGSFQSALILIRSSCVQFPIRLPPGRVGCQ